MRSIIKSLIFLSGVLFIYSCNEDSFSQVVDFEVPLEKNRLVINCNYTFGEDTLKVLVGKTRNVGETKNTEGLEKCKVSLYRNNVKIADIPYAGNYFNENAKIYRISGAKNLISDKSVYLLKVEHPDFETVESTQQVPDAPVLSKPYFQSKGFSSNDIFNASVKYDLAQFELNDPSGENFYMMSANAILLDTIDNITEKSTEYFFLDKVFSKGGIFEDLGNFRHFISDDKFDGKKFDMKLGFSPLVLGNFLNANPNFDFSNAKRTKIILYVYSISKQKYLYENSIEAKDQSIGNFFGETVTVNSNIVNGYGIFSIRNLSTIEIKLP